MSSHVFHEIYLHLNWHVKDDRPTLKGNIETIAWDIIKERCQKTKGVYFHGIGDTQTHIHLAINIEPHVTIKTKANRDQGESLMAYSGGVSVVSTVESDS